MLIMVVSFGGVSSLTENPAALSGSIKATLVISKIIWNERAYLLSNLDRFRISEDSLPVKSIPVFMKSTSFPHRFDTEDETVYGRTSTIKANNIMRNNARLCSRILTSRFLRNAYIIKTVQSKTQPESTCVTPN